MGLDGQRVGEEGVCLRLWTSDVRHESFYLLKRNCQFGGVVSMTNGSGRLSALSFHSVSSSVDNVMVVKA